MIKSLLQKLFIAMMIPAFIPYAKAADSLKQALLFYENCEDLKSAYPGVRISSSIRLSGNGKFGKAFILERRTINSLPNGDLKEKISDFILFRNNAVWRKTGGMKDSSCLQVNSGELVVAMPELVEKSANTLSFYIKSAKPGKTPKVTVEIETGGKTFNPVKAVPAGKQFSRIKAPFAVYGTSATAKIKVSGPVIVDNLMLDQGRNYANPWIPPMKKRGVDKIIIPAGEKYIKTARGAISCWINVPWLNDPQCTAKGVSTLLQTKGEAPSGKTLMAFTGIPRRSPLESPKVSRCYFFMFDKKKRCCSLQIPTSELPAAPENNWRHLVLNWQYENGKLMLEAWLDGKLAGHKEMVFGPLKKTKVRSDRQLSQRANG